MKDHPVVKAILPHFYVFLVFIGITYAYVPQVLKGDMIEQHDMVQNKAMAQEMTAYQDSTGHISLWTNSMFGGMPTFHIRGIYPKNLFSEIIQGAKGIFQDTAYLFIFYMIGMYVLLLVMGVSPWLSAVGAIAYALSTYNIIIIEAGHVSKVRAIAFMPAVVGSVLLAYRGKLLSGAILTAFFVALQIRCNHLQITYYLLFALAFLGVYEFIKAYLDGKLNDFTKATGALIVAGLLGVVVNTSLLWTTTQYANETMRGKSSVLDDGTDKANDALDIGYAMRWSQGKMETFTLLVPLLYGGATQDSVGVNSNIADILKPLHLSGKQVEQITASARTYWGEQPFTSGPVYAGAIICFLALLGMLLSKHPIRWFFLAITLFAIINSWGKNFELFNRLMFDYFPAYNKFRTPSMWLVLAQMGLVALAVLAVKELFDKAKDAQWVQKQTFIAAGVMGGICLIFWLAPTMFFDFKGDYQEKPGDPTTDEQIYGQWMKLSKNETLAQQMVHATQADRKDMASSSAMRSLILILLAGGVIIAYKRNIINKPILVVGALGIMILFDLWTIDKRYLDKDNFVDPSKYAKKFKPSQADLAVLQDGGKDYYRTLNVTVNMFNDALPSYFHKNIGGYHPAKLRRYQDMIDAYIGNEIGSLRNGFETTPILNMLNMRYVITGTDANSVVKNPKAQGNAWFVNSLTVVPTEKEELLDLKKHDLTKEAVMWSKFADDLGGWTPEPDATANIQLTKYTPDELTYESSSAKDGLAVFSEIYYDRNKGWHVTIDGKPATLLKANFALRAVKIPAGKHTIVMDFAPTSYYTGETISLIASIIVLGALGYLIFVEVKKLNGPKAEAA